MKQILLILTGIVLLSSCGPRDDEQALETLDKRSAREVTLMTVTRGDSVYHISRQLIWFNGEKIAEQTDTIVTANKMASWSAADSASSLNKVPIYVTVQ